MQITTFHLRYQPPKKKTAQHQLFVVVLLVGLIGSAVPDMRGADTTSAEETAAIRKQIVALDAGTHGLVLPDKIFWSGAFKRPIIGDEKPEPFARETAPEQRIPDSEKTRTAPIRIVVAGSRDLAYEYSKASVEYDLKSGKHVSFDTGLLRVWQKDGGVWKMAALFIRPYDR